MTMTGDDNITRMTDIHDIKPALSMGFDLQWLFWVLAVLVLLGLVWMAWHRRQQRQNDPRGEPPPPIPPETEALQALDSLAARDGIGGKQFYFALSAIVRRYVEHRFDIPAAEMTTEELLPRVNGLPLEADLAKTLVAFCRSTDPIKFAGADSDRDQMDRDLRFARSFVVRTTMTQEDTAQDSPKENAHKPDPSKTRAPSFELDHLS